VRIQVLFFGHLKDLAGTGEQELVAQTGWRVRDVLDHYTTQFPQMADIRPSIAVARNQRFCSLDENLDDGDELAFLPPVSGGSGRYDWEIQDEATGHFFALTHLPIDLEGLSALVRRPQDGAVVYFVGIVRNNTKGRKTLFLEYEAYEPMAVEMMARIGREIASKLPIGRIAIVHRLGRVDIGETSVAIVVSAPHRKPAFEAVMDGIDRIKAIVPIWKKEHFEDGEIWAEGKWDDSLRSF